MCQLTGISVANRVYILWATVVQSHNLFRRQPGLFGLPVERLVGDLCVYL
jgi:hypothetical protein